MTVTFTGEIHPEAARYPMVADLDALAADIAENGLLDPITLDDDGMLLDGRNRLAACDRAGVEPVFTVYEGPKLPYIQAKNMQRRDLTAGQKAMIAVTSPERVESTHSTRATAVIVGVSQAYIAHALIIRDHAPTLVADVINGAPFNAAYTAAKEARRNQQQLKELHTQLTAHAPDLLDKIDDTFTLEMAHAAYLERDKDRLKREREHKEATRQNNSHTSSNIFTLAHLHNTGVAAFLNTWDDKHRQVPDDVWTPQVIDDAIAALQQLKKAKWIK